MVAPDKVSWGKYKGYEGPYFHGSRKFALSAEDAAKPAFKAFDVITRTEGGAPDAVNAYDRCIVSVGYIQWCEAAYFLTSGLLGHIADHGRAGILDPLKPALEASGADFKRTARGKWRFHFRDARGEVDAKVEQQQLFLLHSSGLKGSWDDESKARARLWVSCLSEALSDPEAERLQVEYTVPRLKWFATKDARETLWGEDRPDEGWTGAVRTGFLSFAGNLPAVAAKHLRIAAEAATAPKWSKDWCIAVLKELTFGPKIAIYPGRYDKIRGPLERNYGVDLPDFASELKAWEAHFDAEGQAGLGEPAFRTLEEIQQLLSDMGYDLGPAGVDGRAGPKTHDAIMTFQGLNGLEADGIVGPKTRAALLKAWRDRVCR